MSDQAALPEERPLKTLDEVFDILQGKGDAQVKEQRLVEPGWVAGKLGQLLHAVQDLISPEDFDDVAEAVAAAIMSSMVLHNHTKQVGRKIVEHVVDQAIASDRGGLILPKHLR